MVRIDRIDSALSVHQKTRVSVNQIFKVIAFSFVLNLGLSLYGGERQPFCSLVALSVGEKSKYAELSTDILKKSLSENGLRYLRSQLNLILESGYLPDGMNPLEISPSYAAETILNGGSETSGLVVIILRMLDMARSTNSKNLPTPHALYSQHFLVDFLRKTHSLRSGIGSKERDRLHLLCNAIQKEQVAWRTKDTYQILLPTIDMPAAVSLARRHSQQIAYGSDGVYRLAEILEEIEAAQTTIPSLWDSVFKLSPLEATLYLSGEGPLEHISAVDYATLVVWHILRMIHLAQSKSQIMGLRRFAQDWVNTFFDLAKRDHLTPYQRVDSFAIRNELVPEIIKGLEKYYEDLHKIQ